MRRVAPVLLMIAVVLGLVVWGSTQSERRAVPSPPPSRGPTATPDPCNAVSSEPGYAVWPEDTLDEARAAEQRLDEGQDPWRRDAEATALEFARWVLRWPDASAAEVPVRSEGAKFSVVRGPDGPSVTLRLEQLLGDYWVVMSVGEGPTGVRVQPDGWGVTAGPEDSEGWVRTFTSFSFGGRTETVMTDRREVREVKPQGPAVPEEPGHVLELYLDAGGEVIGATAVVLPPRCFAAG